MKRIQTIFLLLAGLISLHSPAHGQKNAGKEILIRFQDSARDEYGYINLHGDTVIPEGKYSFCFTDTFRTYAIVATDKAFVGIDRKENILYTVFPFDNGPDYVEDGLFRIVENGKIGYADSATGKIVIRPQFTCARPFENGVAKVSMECQKIPDGEHWTWDSNKWFYIDKKGRKVK